MILVNHKTVGEKEILIGSIKGEKFNIPFDKTILKNLMSLSDQAEVCTTMEDYDKIMEQATSLLTDNRSSEVETACPDIVEIKGNFYLKSNGKVSKHAIPKKLVSKIIESVEKDIDATPIIKLWCRFLRSELFSPQKAELLASYVTSVIRDEEEYHRLIDEEGFSEEVANEMSLFNEVAITKEGLIACRKYAQLKDKKWVIDPETNEPVLADRYDKTVEVDEDTGEVTTTVHYPEFAEDLTYVPPIMGDSGDAFFCGSKEGHIMKVGEVISLPDFSYVNCDDSRSCVKGLHVGKVCRLSA